MPINFPKVMRRLDLVDYGPDYAGIGLELEVWVNPPREMRTKYWTLLAEAAVISERLSVKQTDEDERKKLVERANEVGRDVTLWMSEILSQGNEETRCTPESLQELADQSPRFYQWIMENVYRLIQEYRTDKKKRMNDEMLALSGGRGTDEPNLVNILTAQQVNTALGGPFVSPFEVGSLPDEFVDACTALNTKLPQMQQARAKMEQKRQEFRRNYRKMTGIRH